VKLVSTVITASCTSLSLEAVVYMCTWCVVNAAARAFLSLTHWRLASTDGLLQSHWESKW